MSESKKMEAHDEKTMASAASALASANSHPALGDAIKEAHAQGASMISIFMVLAHYAIALASHTADIQKIIADIMALVNVVKPA